MWSPADLFGPGLNAVLFDVKNVTSYFYQHLMVLAGAIVAAAALIALVTLLGNRRARA